MFFSVQKQDEEIFFSMQMLMKTSPCASLGFSEIHSGFLYLCMCSCVCVYMFIYVCVLMSMYTILGKHLCIPLLLWFHHSVDVHHAAWTFADWQDLCNITPSSFYSLVQFYPESPLYKCVFFWHRVFLFVRFCFCIWSNICSNCWEKRIWGRGLLVVYHFCSCWSWEAHGAGAAWIHSGPFRRLSHQPVCYQISSRFDVLVGYTVINEQLLKGRSAARKFLEIT